MEAAAYQQYDGLGLAELIRNKVISADDAMAAAISLIEAKNPQLNAVHVKDFQRAQQHKQNLKPEQPFAGVPFLIKDMTMGYAGLPTSCGSRYLSEFVWDHDSELVRRYLNAGLVILGKTNVPEFGLSPSSENQTFGDTHNPWDLSRSPGGSSSGAAAAVASGMVPMAHGSDGGGSIRIPASCCGLFGFKPSRGRIPTGPDYGRLWQGLATDHALTRSVRDSAALLDISEGPDVGAPLYAPPPAQTYLKAIEQAPRPLKIAYSVQPFFPSTVDHAVKHAVESAAKLCEDMGHHVEMQDLTIPSEEILHSAMVMMSSELAAGINKFQRLVKHKPGQHDLEITTKVFYEYGRCHRATDFLQATNTFELLTRKIAHFFNDVDVFITPTMARLPIKLHELMPSDSERAILQLLARVPVKSLLRKAISDHTRRVLEYIPFTLLFNITGQPAMSVPMSYADGLPIGVQFASGFGQDAQLLQLARQIEIARPWFDNRPD